jgi:hypothetical protein
MDSLAASAGVNGGRKNRVVFHVHSVTGSVANDVILIDMGGESRKWAFFTHLWRFRLIRSSWNRFHHEADRKLHKNALAKSLRSRIRLAEGGVQKPGRPRDFVNSPTRDHA